MRDIVTMMTAKAWYGQMRLIVTPCAVCVFSRSDCKTEKGKNMAVVDISEVQKVHPVNEYNMSVIYVIYANTLNIKIIFVSFKVFF